MSDHTSTDHADKAKELFLEGYNCAQSVFCAFSDLTGLDMETSARLASSFGGGLGRLREVCGTVSAAAMVLGILKGYSDPKDVEAKNVTTRWFASLHSVFGQQKVPSFAGSFSRRRISIHRP